ncbi:MAG: hypothetical protein ACPHK8_05140 [Thermoplasmatota archaeon]
MEGTKLNNKHANPPLSVDEEEPDLKAALSALLSNPEMDTLTSQKQLPGLSAAISKRGEVESAGHALATAYVLDDRENPSFSALLQDGLRPSVGRELSVMHALAAGQPLVRTMIENYATSRAKRPHMKGIMRLMKSRPQGNKDQTRGLMERLRSE